MAKRKPKAIVVDLDDTVVNFLGFLCFLYNVEHETALAENDFTSWNFKNVEVIDAKGVKVNGNQIRKFFRENEPHLYSAVWEIPEAKQALKSARANGYKIILLTARDEKFRAPTKINLAMRDIPYDELLFDSDKVKQIKRLGRKYKIMLFVDDRLETVKKVSDECNLDYNFIIDKAHNQDEEIDENIVKIRDLCEIVRYLK